jgi:hypothetical protein
MVPSQDARHVVDERQTKFDKGPQTTFGEGS